jgi:lactoylglutathione lyase
MTLEHIALWTNKLEEMKDFYVKYFNGKPGPKYESKHEFSSFFQSYFISFDSGSRLEIMQMDTIPDINVQRKECMGLTHLAFSMGAVEEVRQLTEKLRSDGFKIVGEPHFTGDNYFESCVLDPDGNRVEITVPPEEL